MPIYAEALLLIDIQHLVTETFPKNIEIVVDELDETASVSANATQIDQVFLNLCVNARDAMPDGGTLRLTMKLIEVGSGQVARHDGFEPGSYVKIALSDTGTGIPKNLRENIFQPFFTTKGQDKGTGLGLATTRNIVCDHGGFIELESTEGVGTTFEIYLPAAGDLDESTAVVGSRSEPAPHALPARG